MATPVRSVRAQAILLLLLATLLWAVSFPVVKAMVFAQAQVLPASGTWFITACTVAPRFLLAAVVMLPLLASRLRTLARPELRQGVLIGLAGGLGTLFQNDGLQFTSASVSAFLTQFYAVMIPAWLALRRRRRPPGVVLGCCVLVLVGVAILGRFDFQTLRLGRGELETLLGSGFFMLQILLLDRPEYAGNRMLPVTFVIFAVQGGLFGAMALATAPSPAALLVPWTSPLWLGGTLVLTGFSTLGAYTLMNVWQPRITATEAGLIYCAEPVFASVFALFLPALLSAWGGFDYANERLTWHLLLGGGLITAANVLIQFRPPAPRPAV